jgi:hypothetical protein
VNNHNQLAMQVTKDLIRRIFVHMFHFDLDDIQQKYLGKDIISFQLLEIENTLNAEKRVI